MPENKLEKLSGTEIRYVELTVDACLSRKEIAEKLCRSQDTVATQMKNIYKKLGITKVTELSKLFYKGSLIIMFLISTNTQDNSIFRVRRYRRRKEIEQCIPIYHTEQT